MSEQEAERTWVVYLAGEIHSDWRQQIANGVEVAGLPVVLTGPITDHTASDDAGATILGAEEDKFWHDHKGAGLNAIRTGTMIATPTSSWSASASSSSSGTPPSTPARRPPSEPR